MFTRLNACLIVALFFALSGCNPGGGGSTGGGSGNSGGGAGTTGGGSAQTGGGIGTTGGGSTQTGGGNGTTGGGSTQTGGGVGTTGGGSTQTGGGDGTTGGGSTQTGGGDGTTGGGTGQTGGGFIDLPDASIADAGVVRTCPQGWIQCGDSCIDPSTDHDNCGFCGNVCNATANALSGACTNSVCTIPACTFPYVDVDHSYANGCEGQQDFTISFNDGSLQPNPDGGVPTLFLNAGGTSPLNINIARSNWSGASININFIQANSGTALYANAELNVGDTATVNVQTQSTTPPGTYAAVVNATAGSITHSLPVNVEVTQSSVSVTAVTVSSSGVALPGNEVPPGVGIVTVHVTGTGLLTVSTAWFAQTVLTAVPGGTDTQRDWTFSDPLGACGSDSADACPVALVFKNSSGAALTSFSPAFRFTPMVVDSLNGNDASGRGSWSSPVASLDRAFVLTGTGDTVVLKENAAPAANSAPAGLNTITSYGGSRRIQCDPTTSSIGLHAATGLTIDGVSINGCDAGVVIDDNSGGDLYIRNTTLTNIPHPLEVSIPGAVTISGSTFTAPVAANATISFTTGIVELRNNTFTDVALNAISTEVHLEGGAIQSTAAAVTIGVASTPSTIKNLQIYSTGDGVQLTPGAIATLTNVDLLAANRAVVVNGANATLASCNVHQNETGVFVTGTNPTIFSTGTTALWGNRTMGMKIAPTSGTANATLTLSVAGNPAGVLVQNATGTTTNLTLNTIFIENENYGLRVEGGTTNLTQGSTVGGRAKNANTAVVWLESGNGNLHFTNGAFTAPRGSAIRAQSTAQHEFDVGMGGTVSFDGTGHVFDNTFVLHDVRGGAHTSQIRASFVGSDGHPYAWHGTYNFLGSYNSAVTPRELTSWVTATTFDFGP